MDGVKTVIKVIFAHEVRRLTFRGAEAPSWKLLVECIAACFKMDKAAVKKAFYIDDGTH